MEFQNNMDWFQSWFDTPQYHILYKDRNTEEAKEFVINLHNYLMLRDGAKVWDLCCGKGRHALLMNKLGWNVVATDLSQNSIEFASAYKNDQLDFMVHDMRQPFYVNYFEAVFNLFTSFGYFEKESENEKVIQSVYDSLKPNGCVVIDFFNSNYVVNRLNPFEVKVVEDIEFTIQRKIENNRVLKTISFFENGIKNSYQEVVSLLDQRYFQNLLEKLNFKNFRFFGDYQLSDFNIAESPRLIIIAYK